MAASSGTLAICCWRSQWIANNIHSVHFEELNCNRVRPFDHCRASFTVAKQARFFQHLHARFPQPIQRGCQIGDTERDMINDVAAWADQRAGALARIDYQTDLAET